MSDKNRMRFGSTASTVVGSQARRILPPSYVCTILLAARTTRQCRSDRLAASSRLFQARIRPVIGGRCVVPFSDGVSPLARLAGPFLPK